MTNQPPSPLPHQTPPADIPSTKQSPFWQGGSLVAALLLLGLVLFMLIPVPDGHTTAQARFNSKYNLKQIGLAMHNYHDLHLSFPPGATRDQTGNLYHSWMTLLLPSLGKQPLYNKIELALAWDEPENYYPFTQPVVQYLNPSLDKQQNLKEYALSHYSANELLFFDHTYLNIADISDGLSSTIAAGEIKQNLPAWGDPSNMRDLTLGINRSAAGFGSPFSEGAHLMFADGRVHLFSNQTAPEILKALGTPAGDEQVPKFEY